MFSPPPFLILLLPPLPMTTLKIWKKERTHNSRCKPQAHFRGTFCGEILLPVFLSGSFSSLFSCLQTVREIVLSSFFILFYISFIFFLLLKSPAISASLFFTRTPLGVSSSDSLACCLSCHLAPAKLVYSLPAFSTSHTHPHPYTPPPSTLALLRHSFFSRNFHKQPLDAGFMFLNAF